MTAVAGDNLRTNVSLELLSGAVFEGQIKPLDGVPLQVMYQLDPAPTCGLLPLEVVKQRRAMVLSCGSDVGCIYGRCTIYDLGVSEKVVFSVRPLDAVGQRQLVLQSLARPELGVTVLQLSVDGSALEGGDEHWKPSHIPLVRVKRVVPTASVLETSPCGVVESASKSQRSHELREDVLVVVSDIKIWQHILPAHLMFLPADLRRAVTVEGDRAVFSEIMQIITSAVRELWIAEGCGVCGRPSLLVHNASSGLPPYGRAQLGRRTHRLSRARMYLGQEVGVQLEEVQHTQTKAYGALARSC